MARCGLSAWVWEILKGQMGRKRTGDSPAQELLGIVEGLAIVDGVQDDVDGEITGKRLHLEDISLIET